MLSGDLEGKFRLRADGAPALCVPWRFADLLTPLSVAQFCADYWGRRPLLIQARSPERYRNLIALEDVERCLFIEGLLPSESITTPYRTEGAPEPPPANADEAYDRLSTGKPLRMRRLEKILSPEAPAVALLRDMEAMLGHPKASLSCYISPSAKYGLGPHHDETEIFTLQIRGAKRWRLFHKNVADEPGLWAFDGLDAPVEEFVLGPGDFFYLPSGLVHEVTVESAPAFSLTMVFEPFRWREMLDLVIARLAGDAAFVAPMPAGPLLSEHNGELLTRAFERRLEIVRGELARITPKELMDALRSKHLCKSAPTPRPRLSDVARLDALQPASVLECVSGVAPRLATDDRRVTLTLPGGYSLSAGRAAEPAFRDILARTSPFRVAELHASLGPAAKLALARKLIACGLLRVVDFGSDA